MQAARVGIWRCRSEVSKQWVSGGAEGKQWVSGGAEGKQWVSGGAEGKQWVSGGAEGKQWVFGGAVDVWRCRRQAVGVWGCRRQADCIWRHAKSIVMILSRPFLVPFLVPAFLLSQVPCSECLGANQTGPTLMKLTTICDVSHVISYTRPSSPLFFSGGIERKAWERG